MVQVILQMIEPLLPKSGEFLQRLLHFRERLRFQSEAMELASFDPAKETRAFQHLEMPGDCRRGDSKRF